MFFFFTSTLTLGCFASIITLIVSSSQRRDPDIICILKIGYISPNDLFTPMEPESVVMQRALIFCLLHVKELKIIYDLCNSALNPGALNHKFGRGFHIYDNYTVNKKIFLGLVLPEDSREMPYP